MRSRRAAVLGPLAAFAAVILSACGSSATTSTGPSPLERCSLTLNMGEQNFPADGGSGAIAVTAARECTWTVTVDGTWLSVKSGQSGQGDGRVEFAAAANPDPVTRRGALVLNTQRAEITQAAGACVISLAETAANVPPSGGSGRIDVRASSALCTWTVSADQSWIGIRSGSEGKGSAPVLFDVAPTTGPPRVGTVTVAGQRFSIMQSEGCTYSITPLQFDVGAQGGAGQLSINTASQCPWTAMSSSEWVSFAQSSGTGPATVSFSVQATSGPTRVGRAVVAGQTFTINQGQGCTFRVQPTTHNVPAAGGTGMMNVTAAEGCSWSASSDVSWITIQGVASGAGNGAVMFAADASSGPARTGTLTVAGQKITVTQSQGCTFSISPTQENVAATGASGRITVTADNGCSWSASSPVSWITITGGANATGNGAVSYTVAATDGPARSAALQVAGKTFTVNQATGCTFVLTPATANIREGAATVVFEIRSGAGCPWTATTQTPWITITAPPNGTGTGTGNVQLSIPANAGPPRSGTVVVGGQTFTLGQDGGCAITVSQTSETLQPSGGPGSPIVVNAPAGCAWTAASNADWLSITNPPAPAGGNGPGNVTYAASANTGAQRTGTLTIAGQTFTVTQAGCTYSINPTSVGVPAEGGSGNGFTVTAGPGCQWTAVSQVPWIILTNAQGSGDGAVQGTVEPNTTGAPRTGTVAVAGLTFTVNQQ